jgi:hypothetical protein
MRLTGGHPARALHDGGLGREAAGQAGREGAGGAEDTGHGVRGLGVV